MIGAYRTAIKDELIRSMKQDISLVPVPPDQCDAIKPDSIVFRKVSVRQRDFNKEFKYEPVFPGIILSTPYSEPFAKEKGEVAHDQYVYHFLAQIIDSDNFEPERNIGTYWKWQEQIVRLFQFNCLSHIDAPYVMANAVNVDVVDETMWLRDANFVAGVHITVEVWMTRGAT